MFEGCLGSMYKWVVRICEIYKDVELFITEYNDEDVVKRE